MRAFARGATRLRSTSLSAVPPPRFSSEYINDYADTAASILYRSPLTSESGLPVYILNAAAFPDAFQVDYDALLPYVLARLPGEEELIAGEEYEIVFFAGGQAESATSDKKTGPGMGWYLQAYHVLSRAVRKRLQKLYVVHERSWVRVLIEVFGTMVSPKFRKKIVHVSTLTSLALHIPIEKLLIPPSVYLHDRRLSPDVHSPYVSGRRAFGANDPMPRNLYGQRRLPRVLRETTTFLCQSENIKTEGIFRIPPQSIFVGILREAYDRGQQFIVWKEGGITYSQPDLDHHTLRHIQQTDAYGVHLAAGLIKLWYRELKTPIFHETCYDELRYKFGDSQTDIELDDLVEMLSPTSSASCLSQSARLILILHLFPLLSLVTSHQKINKMTPDNLAICFSPALVCGSDQLADAKMTSIVRRILEAAVEHWPHGLRDACQTAPDSFAAALRPPPAAQDYEDPLQENYRDTSSHDSGERFHRIHLQDDESASPPLPPRPMVKMRQPEESNSAFPARTDSLASPVKRKPAPIGVAPPPHATFPSRSVSQSYSSQSSTLNDFTDVRNALPYTESPPNVPSKPSPPQPAPPAQNDLMKELRNSLATDIAKRKPVSSTASPGSTTSNEAPSVPPHRSVSARVPSPPKRDNDITFVKPTWAASSRAPSRQASISNPAPAAPAPPTFARTPSPGLLKRMASIESVHKTSGTAHQGEYGRSLPVVEKSGLRKSSVDDLKRIYEERAGLARAASVSSVGSGRRASNASLSRRTSNAAV
ncbi:Rho GTPase activation protein, partial [Aureobasidium sp. EXF-3399]